MKKICYLLLVLCFVCYTPKVKAEAETLGDLRKIYEDLVAQKRTNENKTEAAKQEIARKEAAIKTAETNLTNARREEAETQEKIDESNERIEKLTEEAKNVLLYLQQMKGQNAYVEYVTGASNMTDLITRLAVVEQISNHIQDTMKNLEDEIKKNEALKIELQEKQKALEKEITNYQAAIQKQYQNLAQYDKFALGIDEQIQVAKEKYEANKRTCQQNIGSTDDSVVLTTCSKVPVNGGWLKPLNRGYVTSEIGSRWGSYHNALDIGGNAEGTPVYAAAAGTVSGKIAKYRCGGNMLYIDVIVGGKKYTTYYYHLLRFNVNVGDVVTQDTIIGYVGGGRSTSAAYGGYDTCTTGAHLHYGVANGWFTGTIYRGNVITPPGFPNSQGYRFYSRTDYYR
ncbi:MAG: peptidoglycan DD-metalloendopeptidase family protein [Bacilli bacterium]|nr:peptidoglycan DD-metalloendopeptidase family protein [Bacilli bacterium]